VLHLTFKWPGWYFNFSTWFMTKWVLFEQRKIKLWNKQNFMWNITEIIQHVWKIQYLSFLPTYMKLILVPFFNMFSYVNAFVLRVHIIFYWESSHCEWTVCFLLFLINVLRFFLLLIQVPFVLNLCTVSLLGLHTYN